MGAVVCLHPMPEVMAGCSCNDFLCITFGCHLSTLPNVNGPQIIWHLPELGVWQGFNPAQFWAYIQALHREKWKSLLFSGLMGAVVTNDWCISRYFMNVWPHKQLFNPAFSKVHQTVFWNIRWNPLYWIPDIAILLAGPGTDRHSHWSTGDCNECLMHKIHFLQKNYKEN